MKKLLIHLGSKLWPRLAKANLQITWFAGPLGNADSRGAFQRSSRFSSRLGCCRKRRKAAYTVILSPEVRNSPCCFLCCYFMGVNQFLV